MNGHLNPCGGGDSIPLTKPRVLIGRRSRCDITLEFPNVSSHHCELEFVNGYWQVRDLNSTNGIKINGERRESCWLMPGDVLHVAKHLFEIHYQPLGDRPPPEELEGGSDLLERGLLKKAGLERPSDLDEPPERPARRRRQVIDRNSPLPPPLPPKLDMD